MEEILRQVRQVLRAMWPHHWIGLIVVWIVGFVAAAVIFLMPDKYEASARVFVDTDTVLKPLLSGLTVIPNTEQQVAMLSRTLISRPNIEKLIRMADLDLKASTAQQKEGLIDAVKESLKISRAGGDNLYTITYRDIDPERARKAVQSLTTIFVESSLGSKRDDTDTARKFIDDQIAIYIKRLEDAEGRLKSFKLKNIEVGLDKGGGAGGRLEELGVLMAQARLELREAENSRDTLKRQLSGEEPIIAGEAKGPGEAVGIVPEIDSRLDAQKRNLDMLLQRYTEQHPDVVGTRRMIKELEGQRLGELAARRYAAKLNPTASPLNANPVYQKLKISLAEAEAAVAALQVRVSEFESRHAKAVSMIKAMPEIEAEYAQLNRDYEINKKNYESLLQRRESAAISEGMADIASVADFRIIDPPRTTPTPVAPNRILLLALAFLGSLAAGMGTAFAAGQIKPLFFEGHTLREVSGLPLLGVVSRVVSSTERKRKRRDLVMFSTVLAGFALLYGGILVYVARIIFRGGV